MFAMFICARASASCCANTLCLLCLYYLHQGLFLTLGYRWWNRQICSNASRSLMRLLVPLGFSCQSPAPVGRCSNYSPVSTPPIAKTPNFQHGHDELRTRVKRCDKPGNTGTLWKDTDKTPTRLSETYKIYCYS